LQVIFKQTVLTIIELDSPSDALLIIDRGSTSDVARLSWRNAGSEFFKAGIETTSNDLWSLLHTCGNGLYFEGAAMNLSFGNSSVAFPSGSGFQVYSASNPRIKLANSTTGVGASDGTQIYMDSADVIYDQKDSGNQRWYTGGAERMRLDNGGSIIIGAGATSGTPASDYRSLEIGRQGNTITGAPWKSNLYLTCNATITGGSTAFTYRYASEAPARMDLEDGNIVFYNAPAGTVGNTISWTERLRVDANGAVYNPNSGGNTWYGSNSAGNPANVTGSHNSSFGYGAGRAITSSSYNVSIGSFSFDVATTGERNTSVGTYSNSSVTTGSYNVASGYGAAGSLTTVNW